MNTNEPGLLYWLETVAPDGTTQREGPYHNLVPYEGLNYLLNVAFKGLTPVTAWYVGLFEANFTPFPEMSASMLPAAAQECTAYAPATRVPAQFGDVTDGATNNAAALAEFTFTADKTVMGCFVSSAQSKGSTLGVLMSAVRFPSPRVQTAGSILRVLAGPTAIPI